MLNTLIQILFFPLKGAIRQLYRNGPAWKHIGFWQGKSDEEICAYLTDVPYPHWVENPKNCESVIRKHEESVFCFVHFFLFCFLYYGFITRILPQLCFLSYRLIQAKINNSPQLEICHPHSDRYFFFSLLKI